jgi:hypothetical protein
MLKIVAKLPILPRSMFIHGVRIDRSQIGWGGFGDVFKGEFRGKPVAVKLLRTARHNVKYNLPAYCCSPEVEIFLQ